MKTIRRDERGFAMVIVVLILIIVVAIAFVAAYALGYLSPSQGAKCPLGLDCSNAIWIRVDITGTVVPNAFGPPTILGGSMHIAAAQTAAPATLVRPPPGILDENSVVSGTISVTYPNGVSYQYTLPSQNGLNQYNFDLFYFIQGPHGSYTMSALITLQQTGCWLGCAGPGQYPITGAFTF